MEKSGEDDVLNKKPIEKQIEKELSKINSLIYDSFHKIFNLEKNEQQGKIDEHLGDGIYDNEWQCFISLLNEVANMDSNKDLTAEDKFEKYLHMWVVSYLS